MNELKIFTGGDIHDDVEFTWNPDGPYPVDTEYYRKADVDKVLSEKEEYIEACLLEIRRLKDNLAQYK